MIEVASECDPMLEGPNLSFLNKATNTVLNSQNMTKADILFVFVLDWLIFLNVLVLNVPSEI